MKRALILLEVDLKDDRMVNHFEAARSCLTVRRQNEGQPRHLGSFQRNP